MSDPTPSYGAKPDNVDAIAKRTLGRGEYAMDEISDSKPVWPWATELANAVLLRGAEIKTLREELAAAKGPFILCKEPLSEEVIAQARPGKIIAKSADQRLVEENERLRAALEEIRPRVVKYCPSGIPIIDKALGTQGGGA